MITFLGVLKTETIFVFGAMILVKSLKLSALSVGWWRSSSGKEKLLSICGWWLRKLSSWWRSLEKRSIMLWLASTVLPFFFLSGKSFRKYSILFVLFQIILFQIKVINSIWLFRISKLELDSKKRNGSFGQFSLSKYRRWTPTLYIQEHIKIETM